ncbi:MAG TPA: hypothetical protein VF789_28230 [Thermoanaerobaculia bacterium]
MAEPIREHATVQPGGLIEIRRPDIPVGTEVDVVILVGAEEVILVQAKSTEPLPPLSSFVGKGKGCFKDAAEVDAFIRAERDAWDR